MVKRGVVHVFALKPLISFPQFSGLVQKCPSRLSIVPPVDGGLVNPDINTRGPPVTVIGMHYELLFTNAFREIIIWTTVVQLIVKSVAQ